MAIDRLRRVLAGPEAPMAVGLWLAVSFPFLFARRLWFAPQVVDVACWLALPLGALLAWRARRVVGGASRMAAAILLLVVGYVAAAAILFAATALTLPLLGRTETLVVPAERWNVRFDRRLGVLCARHLVGRTPEVVAGGEMRFCADRFPLPILPVPAVRLTLTHSPHVAWRHDAEPAVK